jgi:hypothetical protein
MFSPPRTTRETSCRDRYSRKFASTDGDHTLVLHVAELRPVPAVRRGRR